jgi:tRNA-splicing ligase RtcB
MAGKKNMQIINDPGQRFPIKAWIDGVEIEDEARKQLVNIANMPFIFKHVAVMPDVHLGKGATIGSVIATKGAVLPSAVGVDLGCGMLAVRTTLTASYLPDDLAPLRSEIEKRIPHGRTDNGGANDRGAWHDVPLVVQEGFEATGNRIMSLASRNPGITGKGGVASLLERAQRQLGTQGTGNHFCEICLDESGSIWVMLHSGSRGIGNILASYYIEKAKEQAAKYCYEAYLPDKELAWLAEGTPIFDEYVEAILIAQDYALANRLLMMQAAKDALATLGLSFECPEEAVNCHHNYLSRENHFGQNVLVTRKGAVRAREGDLGIIPGSMGAKSFIVRGKGNRDSFMSCSHGAGRRMSRGEAKRRFTVEDHIAATEGVECRKDAGVIDETPGAYKDIDRVIAAQSDLIEVVHSLKAVLCVKG